MNAPLHALRSALALVVRCALPCGVLAVAPAAAQTTFVVNTTADPGDGTCDAAECTLREAIAAANAAPGEDLIHFAIPGPGVHTIHPATDLPVAAGPVVIDGYTQPGASPNTRAVGNDAVLLIQLSGTGSGRGIAVSGTGGVVRGLVVNGFGWNGGGGILTLEGSGHVVAGNFVGTDPTGTLDMGNVEGVVVFRSTGVRVGGTAPADRNVVSGNGTGLVLSDAPSNVIEGNYIGTTADGSAALGNSGHGIGIGGAWGGSNGNRVGGAAPGAGNVISGNGTGVSITGDWNNVVQGNRIGTDAAGTVALPNETGIGVGGNPGAYNLLIGGTEPGAGNVISGNTGRGVMIADPHVALVTVQGNLIGVALDGVSPLGNGEAGVHIGYSIATGTSGGGPAVVGGAEPGAANVIAHNGGNGVTVHCCEGRPSTISGNALFANGGLAVDLGSNGPTANDPGDADGGANRLQNFPDLLTAGRAPGALTVAYRVDTDPANATYPLRVELFRALDGQAAAFLGADTYTEADFAGCGAPPCPKTAAFTPAAPVAADDLVVATATDADGNTSELSPTPAVVVASAAGPAPAATALHPPAPNPAAGAAVVRFDLAAPGPVRLAVYDVLGREVAVLAEGARAAGRHETALGADLPAGRYVVRLTAGGHTTHRPLTRLR